MAVLTLQQVNVDIRLDDGVDSEGNIKTIGLLLPSINKNTFDPDKVIEILRGIGPCLSKTIEFVHVVETYTLTA